jgi:hypothetical protein
MGGQTRRHGNLLYELYQQTFPCYKEKDRKPLTSTGDRGKSPRLMSAVFGIAGGKKKFMAQAIRKAKTMPVVPPRALPMKTMRTVSRERRKVVLSRFIVGASDEIGYRRG